MDGRAVELLLARPHAELPHAEQDDDRDEHEDRDRGDDQQVPQVVDRLGLGRRLLRKPLDGDAEGDADRRGDRTDDQHLQNWCALLAPGLLAHADRDPMRCARRTTIRCCRARRDATQPRRAARDACRKGR